MEHIACFRSAMTYDAFNAISDRDIDADLKTLEHRGLFHWDKIANKYDCHPIVRRYAYERLTAADQIAAHTHLRDYVAGLDVPEPPQSLDALTPVIELYHHNVQAGEFVQAFLLLTDRLVPNPLHFQFGAYQLIIEFATVHLRRHDRIESEKLA